MKNTKGIYYRAKGDRKFRSSNKIEVVDYMVKKKGLSNQQRDELLNCGTTQDEKHSVNMFRIKKATQ